ncbi:hypothetical protein MB84_27875 (plasmid) [Pandoraea oxalativorans]|uniref:Uncharacterized protein n=1 Tax=Pandoraea oxalativorans TaxID=573737 RepID=A0A0G3IBT1_9BURK|nr:hypothetical protein MB84_27875 [Pandoraea oxalativorans]
MFRDILNAPLTLGAIEDLPAVCVCLADRFLGTDACAAECLTISIAGEAPDGPLDFTDIANDASLAHEAGGKAVLKRIAEHIVPPLLLGCLDTEIAYAAALQIATQLGDAEFAALGPSAVRRAVDDRLTGGPLGTTHIALEGDGTVLVHQRSQWAAYVDGQGQTVASEHAGTPVLEVGWLAAFRVVPLVSDSPRANANATKRFALHGHMRHCYLDTLDAGLKTMLTRYPSSLDDDIAHRLASVFEKARIRLEPRTHDVRRSRTPLPIPHDTARRMAASATSATGTCARPRAVQITTPSQASGVRGVGVPALIHEQLAVSDFCDLCVTRVRQLILKSATEEDFDSGGMQHQMATPRFRFYNEAIVAYRKDIPESLPPPRKYLAFVLAALKYSTGNCVEMALTAAAFAQLKTQDFFSMRGHHSDGVKAEIYGPAFYDPQLGGSADHFFCVLNLVVNGHPYKMAVDPWMWNSMPCDAYLRALKDHPMPPITQPDTLFVTEKDMTDAINHPDFTEPVRSVFNRYAI